MKVEIVKARRMEFVTKWILRAIGLGEELTHWNVLAKIDGKVEVNNLLKFNTGLKLFVESIEKDFVVLSTIKEEKKIEGLTNCIVRMDHWKYGRINNK